MIKGFWFYLAVICCCGGATFLISTAGKRVIAAERVAAERAAAAERVAAAERAAEAERANAPPAPAPMEPESPTEPEKPPTRAKVSCAEYRLKTEQGSSPAGFDIKLKSGSWGAIPKELRKLPPRATLCGSDGRGQVVITSPLYGADLEAFYAPMFVKLGFPALTCKAALGRTQCTGKRKRDLGVLVTDRTTQAFVLAFVRR